uniref:Uncharacterized protein n=1 Tax=Anguilla anguilla TaxID=7936 RepID=A0A0E9UC42_ANGAN
MSRGESVGLRCTDELTCLPTII